MILHEVIHAMGFISLIDPNGQSAQGVTNHFARYDLFLKDQASGTPFMTWDNCYAADYTAPLSFLTAGRCNGMIFDGANAGQQPIYTPGPTDTPPSGFQGGSSLSHFDNNCNPIGYVMHPFLGPGQFHKVPTPEEILTLCDVGYKTTGKFGIGLFPTLDNGDPFHNVVLPKCGNIVAGVNDGIGGTQVCSEPIIVESCSTKTIQHLINDIGATTFDCLEILDGPGVIVSQGQDDFGFDPQGVRGVTVFRYIPVGADGTRGNITCIKVISGPCGEETCAGPPPNCNQICNPAYSERHAIQNLVSHGSPDFIPGSNNNPPNPGYTDMWALGVNGNCGILDPTTGEGVLYWVNVKQGRQYIFSYFRRKAIKGGINEGPSIDNIHVRLIQSANSPLVPNLDPSDTEVPVPPGNQQEILLEQNIFDGPYVQVVVCFTAIRDYDWLWIYPEQNPGSFCPDPVNNQWQSVWLSVDQVELIEDGFIVDDVEIECGNVEIGKDLCAITNTQYEWRVKNEPGVIGTGDKIIVECLNETTTFELTRTFPITPSTVVFKAQPGTCPATVELTVTVTNPLVINARKVNDDQSCDPGINNGQATVDITSGGIPPFTFLWENKFDPSFPNEITQTINQLGPGCYQVTVTDDKGCCAIDKVFIENKFGPTLATQVVNVSCEGGSDGEAEVIPSGAGPFTFLWFPGGQTTPKITNLVPGTYIVQVTDANGCVRFTEVEVLEGGRLELDVVGNDVTCITPIGGATVNVTGGTAPFGFQWDDPALQTGQAIFGLPPGTYHVTVIDANGCTGEGEVTINDLDLRDLKLSSDPDCLGDGVCDGIVRATVDGGALPLSFQWDDPGASITPDIEDLCLGTYNVTITDALGCTIDGSVNVEEIPICDMMVIPTAGHGDLLCFVLPGEQSPCCSCPGACDPDPDTHISLCPGNHKFNVNIDPGTIQPFPNGTVIEIIYPPFVLITSAESKCKAIPSPLADATISGQSVFVRVIDSDELGKIQRGDCRILTTYFTTNFPVANWSIKVKVTGPCCEFETSLDFGCDLCPYDPNKKRAIPEGCGEPGFVTNDEIQPITYEVTYQNVGTGPAEKVILRDTIDTDLDINSVQIVAADHRITDVDVSPISRELVITHDSIFIPPFVDNPGESIGLVRYSILPASPSLLSGTTILNSTGIIFNGQPAIQTNVVVNTIIDDLPVTVEAEGDDFVIIGFGGDTCVTLTATADGALPPYEFLWSTGETTQSIEVCPKQTTTFSIVADASGCLSEPDSVTVEVVDVRCGKNGNKVLMCHISDDNPSKTQEICVSPNAVESHLAKGDRLGPCDSPLGKRNDSSDKDKNEENINDQFQLSDILLESYPNPTNGVTTIKFGLPTTQNAQIILYSLAGKRIAILYNNVVENGLVNNLEFDASTLPNGIYQYQLVTSTGVYTKKLAIIW